MLGLGYKGACQLRLDEGYTTQKHNGNGYEEPGHERYCLYLGRSHIHDHETNVMARGLLKVGRAKYLSAVIRSRNQPGNDFRIYYAIYVPNDTQSWRLEEIFKGKYKNRNVPGDEGQQELYNIEDKELKQIVDDLSEHALDINLNPKVISYV
jgi:hypothetical protein|tara:strand:- start:63 stop:518 length:456 start_codon:yes stop_codon:yes gene_type:complete